MSSDAEMISKAILDLKNNSDVVKDYIFPICMSFFSAFIGALFGYCLYKRQVLVGYEEVKFNAAMDAILKYKACFHSLYYIKSNFKSDKTDDPVIRAIGFPQLTLINDKVNEDVLALSFILAKPEKKTQWYSKNKNEISKEASSWANLSRVRMQLTSFNQVIALINVRSSHSKDIFEKFHKSNHDTQEIMKNPELFLEVVGKDLVATYIDLTEQCVFFVNFLIKEMHSFLLFFPELAKANLDTSLIKHRGPLLDCLEQRNIDNQILTPLPKPNFEKIASILGASVEEIKKRYPYGE